MGKIHDCVNRLPRYARWIIGIFFILIGIVGLLMPIMPGLIFIIPGIYFLGEDTRLSRWMIGKIHSLRRKWHDRKTKKSDAKDTGNAPQPPPKSENSEKEKE